MDSVKSEFKSRGFDKKGEEYIRKQIKEMKSNGDI